MSKCNKAPVLFIASFLTLYILLNTLIGVLLVNWSYLLSVIFFLIMAWLNIGMAYSMAGFLFTLFLKPTNLPYLAHLSQPPKVALLYTTCNDAIPEIISKLKEQTWKHCDVFILDDSSSERFHSVIDDLAIQYGYQVVRRRSRDGFKAGNLNNWLRLYGAQYDYFVVLDADSIIEADFVERMLKYAEHPANHHIAVFQSKILPWNTTKIIPRMVKATSPLWIYELDRLVNQCEFIPAWGHNNLCRISAFSKIGGFDESFISEDYATALNLIEIGFITKLVDIISYEAVPEAPASFTKRAVRWAQQTLQLEFRKTAPRNLSLASKLHLFMNTYHYLSYLIYACGMMLAVWSYKTDFFDVVQFVGLITSGEITLTPFVWLIAISFFYIMVALFIRLPLAMYLGVAPKIFYMHMFLMWSLNFYMMFHIVKAICLFFLGVRPTFQVTEKTSSRTQPKQFIKDIIPLLIFNIILIIGVLRNPLSLIFSFPWLIPLVITPAVAYVLDSQNEHRKPAISVL